MKENNIKLARRKTGGGAVYQDLGNSIFSFITPISNDLHIDDCKNTNNQILTKALKNLNITAEPSGRNDIICEGKKVNN